MNPEEKALLERTAKIAEENNLILKKLQRNAHWQTVWTFVKVLVVLVPLAIGYLFLQPYLGSVMNNFKDIQSLLNSQ